MTFEELELENENLKFQLEEARQNIDAIRTGQIDALVVKGNAGHTLYTLKTADQTYRLFIEKMSEGAITLNHSGFIMYSNSKFALMVDMPLSKVIGLSFRNLIHPTCQSEFDKVFSTSWVNDHKIELLLVDTKLKSTSCILSMTSLLLNEGVSLSIIITDLTHQKKVEKLLKLNNEKLEKINQQLEQSNLDLLQFAYVASHDLQEPLRKILLYSDRIMTRHTKELSEQVFKYFEKIRLSSQRMQNLILDILAYSKLSTEIAAYTPTDLNDIIAEILDDLEFVILEKKATLDIRPLPTLMVNRGQIRQVFQNLLSNALKFSQGEITPHIVIKCEFTPPLVSEDSGTGYYSIIFVDNGIGFEADQYEKIFSLFHRLHSRDKYDGTGIGLAIAKRIVEKHNGVLQVKSDVGIGSEFSVRLPANTGVV